MGDEADYDYDEGYDYDDGWLYVEDDFSLADELAESAVPDPGYAGTSYELGMETYDYDFYAYWDDVEYADDAYWDGAARPPSSHQKQEGIGKRKRTEAAAPARGKRRKLSAVAGRGAGGQVESERVEGMDTVLFVPQGARRRRPASPQVVRKGCGSAFALIPDWRQRFAGEEGVVLEKRSMPVDMREAAEASPTDDAPTKVRSSHVVLGDGEGEEEWEDDEDVEEGDEVAGTLGGLDPAALQAVLTSKLAEAGLAGVDASAFMESITKLLSGQAVNDDATGELASMLLAQAGGDSAVAGFLSQQGVSLGNGDDDGEEEEEEDSAISGLDGSPAVNEKAREQMSPPRPGSTARQGRRKGKNVRFAELSMEDQGERAEGPMLPTPPSSGDPQADDEDDDAQTANTAALTHNGRIDGPSAQLERELDGASEITVQSRKRKAPVADHVGESNGGEEVVRAKKQPATKRTRNARAGG